jgi:hypothetical protein
MLQIVGSSLVVVFDTFPGVRLAAAWSGGPYVQIHAVDGSGFGIVVDAWSVWDDWLDAPKIPRTLEALEDFVRARLDDPEAVSTLVELTDSAVGFHDDQDVDELVAVSLN